MLKLEVVTPEKKVVEAEVDSVTVPTASGEVGILPNHAPLISALKPGILSYSAKGSGDKLVVAGGFVEVSNDTVAVLADSAETADEIRADISRLEEPTSATGAVSVEEAEASREIAELERARAAISASR